MALWCVIRWRVALWWIALWLVAGSCADDRQTFPQYHKPLLIRSTFRVAVYDQAPRLTSPVPPGTTREEALHQLRLVLHEYATQAQRARDQVLVSETPLYHISRFVMNISDFP